MSILDCTLRDGGYINNWRFNHDFLTKHKKCMNDIGVKYVEIGFINKQKIYRQEIVGRPRNLTIDHIQLYYGDNTDFEVVVMGDFKDIDLDMLHDDRCREIVDLVRIAFHKKDMIDALKLCSDIKEMGYKVSANAMGVTNYNDDDIDTLLTEINRRKIDVLYIADSYGSLNNASLIKILDEFSEKLTDAVIGLHLHNNMQNAFSNYESIKGRDDVGIIDTTLYGMGRGAGNLQTELVWLSMTEGDVKQQLMDLCYFINDYIKSIDCVQRKWGYDLDYLFSGYLKIHPNYVSKMRDLEIDMKTRLFLLSMVENGRYFNIDNMFYLIQKYIQY
jgi:4-hydroxy 2-oxovalerate aldolase